MENFINSNNNPYNSYISGTEITLPLKEDCMTADMKKYVSDLKNADDALKKYGYRRSFYNYLTISISLGKIQSFTLKTRVRNDRQEDFFVEDYVPNLTTEEKTYYFQQALSHIADFSKLIDTIE